MAACDGQPFAKNGNACIAGGTIRPDLPWHRSRIVRSLIGETTMLQLNERQRTVWIDTLSQAANVALAGLLFGQFVSDRPFSIILAVGGVAAWSALIGWSTFLARGRNR